MSVLPPTHRHPLQVRFDGAEDAEDVEPVESGVDGGTRRRLRARNTHHVARPIAGRGRNLGSMTKVSQTSHILLDMQCDRNGADALTPVHARITFGVGGVNHCCVAMV